MNEYACGTCKVDFVTERKLEWHLNMYPSHHYRDEKNNFHLSPESVIRQGSAPAIVLSRRTKRYVRKSEERFHRQCIRSKAAANARRAERHGWKKKEGVRKRGDTQL